MKNHDDHPTREELRQFVDKYGPEILEVVRRQNLQGVDDVTRFQSALRELSVRWGIMPDPDASLEELLAEGFEDEDEPEPA
jgi:hypothetical protein